MLSLAAAQQAHSEVATYDVIMSSPEAQRISIRAEFDLTSDVIGMYITSSPQLASGQADLVRDLRVFATDGSEIETEFVVGGDWRLAGVAEGQRVRVEYDIALEHDQYSWGPGIDEVAYHTPEGLFFVGNSLFVVPLDGLSDGIDVTFDLPAQWSASLAWSGTRVPSLQSFLRNCMFLGSHQEEVVRVGDFELTMVLGGDYWEKKDLFVKAMKPILKRSVELFGGMPLESRYLVIVNPGDRNDGGAFTSSYSLLINGVVNESSSVIWGHGMAHEVIHFWNGHSLRPKNNQEEWFKEGFTDYITFLLRAREGLDTRERSYRKLENCLRRYVVAKRMMNWDVSMREAGDDKHNKRFLVYGGGTLIGFVLDVRIRQATENKKGIDEFLAAFFAEFGDGVNAYDMDDIVRIANDVCGEDFTGFFAQYVDGKEFLDVAPIVRGAGLQLDMAMDEFYVSPNPDATKLEKSIHDSLFGR